MFSLESPHQCDSNEYTQYTIFYINTKNHPKLFQICIYEIFSKRLKNKLQTAVVNKTSVFEPLKFYCRSDETFVFFFNFAHKILFSAFLWTKV